MKVKVMKKKLRMMNGENSEMNQVKNREEMELKNGAQILWKSDMFNTTRRCTGRPIRREVRSVLGPPATGRPGCSAGNPGRRRR